MFTHHVFFWLNEMGNDAHREQLKAGLKELAAAETIKDYYIGEPAGTSRDVVDGSWSVSWLLFFEDREAHDTYQTAPIHLEFIRKCSPLWSKVLVYDAIVD